MNTPIGNILILDNSPSITGAYKSIVSVAKTLQKKHHFVFTSPSPPLVESLSRNKISAYHIPFLEIQKNWRLFFYIPVLIINCFRIQRIINKHQINIIHVNDLYNMCGTILKIFNPKLSLVYHVRLLPTSYAKKLYFIWRKLIEKYADEIIFVSNTVASNFKRGVIIYDAIPDTISPQLSSKKQQNERFTILYLSNYIEGKGHKQAIDAYKLALPSIDNTQLVFKGGTLGKLKNQAFKNTLVNYTAKLGLEKHITFNEFSNNPKADVIKADLMLNFSESESFSMTTLEALVYETPIIATACGGPSEIIEHNKSGMLVSVNDILAMSKAIIRLTNDAALRTLFILEGKKRAESKFDFNNQVNLVSSVYTRLLK